MDKVVIVTLGYNEIKNFIGAFTSIEEAEKSLIEAGAKLIEEHIKHFRIDPEKTYRIPRQIIVTKEFIRWMGEHGFSCYEAKGLSFMIDEFPLNQISYGYDTD